MAGYSVTITDQNETFYSSLGPTYNGSTPSSQIHSSSDDMTSHVLHIGNNIIIPSVFIVGILGNIINLIVFNYKDKGGRRNTSVIERSATAGLITLAVSDLLFCLVGFPALILSSRGQVGGGMRVASFYYGMYKKPLLNIFLFSSTWLITLISAERCLAVCFPHLASTLITVNRTVVVHMAVFAVSLCLNIPLFFTYTVLRHQCTPDRTCYYPVASWFFHEATHTGVHFIIWSLLGTFLPLFMLVACNAGILQSIFRRRHHGSNSPERHHMMKTTMVLVAMVFCFLICVCPSIILQFLSRMDLIDMNGYILATMVTNLLQAIKFSANFILYCVLHKKFRETIAAMRCKGDTKPLVGQAV